MKRCIECNFNFDTSLSKCPQCDFSPVVVDGFQAYAPESSHGGGGFKSHYFSVLSKLEDDNFWFRARNKLIVWALNKYSSGFKSFFEIGCGTGFVLSGVSKAFPDRGFSGSEIFTDGLKFAAARLPSVDFLQMDARDIPYSEEFDVVGAFDVLEHIEEDITVMKQVNMALKPGGVFLITVPQHKWLWSATDDYACHVRRYTAKDIHKKLISTGFDVVRSTSFVSSLLPAMVVSRFLQKKDPENIDATAELKLSAPLNYIFYLAMSIDIVLIKLGVNFPVGGSRIVVARKSTVLPET